jgi:hypothetical protein
MKFISSSFLLLLALSPVCGFAQGRFMYGINGGFNIGARYEVPESPGFSSYTTGKSIGLLAGIEIGYFDWHVGGLSVQALFDQRGYIKYGYETLIDFIEIPITIKVPVITHVWRVYLVAGPVVGVSEGFGITDVGISGGIGFSHPLNKSADIFLQVNYTYGLDDISGPFYYDLQQGSTYYREYSRDIRIQFGILFGKKLK